MQVLLTTREALQALEELFLDARHQINCGFTRFDPATPLLSARAVAIGQSWGDLLGHTLARGVAVKVTISDFDPVQYPAAHLAAHVAIGKLRQVALQCPGAIFDVSARYHDGQTGFSGVLRRWPTSKLQVVKIARWLNGQVSIDKENAIANMPGLRNGLQIGRNGKIRIRLLGLPPERRYSHNQKMAVIDQSKIFIGSFDLDQVALDVPDLHGLSLVLTGPVVAEGGAHLDRFLANIAGEGAAPALSRLLLRTLSGRRASKKTRPRNISILQDIWKMHETLVRLTTRLIYIETGSLQEPHLTAHLIKEARANKELTMILVLHRPVRRGPGWSRQVEWQQMRTVRQLAQAFGERLFVGGYVAVTGNRQSPDALPGTAPHDTRSNVSIFDSRAGIVSSARLDRVGLHFNTEAGVYVNSPVDLAELRRAVMARWLPADAPEPFFALETAVGRWTNLARENAKKPINARRGLILPYRV